MTDLLTISVVSHGQVEMVNKLLRDIARHCCVMQVIVTQNIHESDVVVPKALEDKVEVIQNDRPKGFGANHNQAFQRCAAPLYCVINPDISFSTDPFTSLIDKIDRFHLSILAPRVLESDGTTADNGRIFPTPWNLMLRVLGFHAGIYKGEKGKVIFPDWVGGMCMVIRSEDFMELGGFDESYFMYVEDVDICLRAWSKSKTVALDTDNHVIHEAQRLSRKNLRHQLWHIRSLLRFWLAHHFQNPRHTR